jgi:hypothetical protein
LREFEIAKCSYSSIALEKNDVESGMVECNLIA